MGPIDIAIIAAVVLILGGAVAYVIIAKRKGQKCVGCPASKTCGVCSGCKGKYDSKTEK